MRQIGIPSTIAGLALGVVLTGCGGGGGSSCTDSGPGIYYTISNSQGVELNKLNTTESCSTQEQLIPSTVAAVTSTTAATPTYLFAASIDNGQYGVYENTSLSTTGATVVLAPTFDSVTSIFMSPDGSKTYLVASSQGVSSLYVVSNSVATAIDTASSAALSADGTKLAYAKFINGSDSIFEIATANGTPLQVTSGFEDDDPAWSPDGSTIAFSRATAGAPTATFGLYSVHPDGSNLQTIATSSTVNYLGCTYSPDGTEIATAAFDAQENSFIEEVPANGSTTPKTLATVPGLVPDLDWSSLPKGAGITYQEIKTRLKKR
jgi:Tol biopolymer transport system component